MKILAAIVVLLLIAGGGVYWFAKNQSQPPAAIQPLQPGQATAVTVTPAQEVLDKIVFNLQSKGATVIERRVLGDFKTCADTLDALTGEYVRRGIKGSSILDASPLLGTPGKVMVMVHNNMAYYAACIDFEAQGWVGYIQYSMTEAQMKALKK